MCFILAVASGVMAVLVFIAMIPSAFNPPSLAQRHLVRSPVSSVSFVCGFFVCFVFIICLLLFVLFALLTSLPSQSFHFTFSRTYSFVLPTFADCCNCDDDTPRCDLAHSDLMLRKHYSSLRVTRDRPVVDTASVFSVARRWLATACTVDAASINTVSVICPTAPKARWTKIITRASTTTSTGKAQLLQ